MVEQTEQVIQQTTLVLPYFNDEVAVLSTRDETGYVPVITLCNTLGLHMLCGIWTVCCSTREAGTSLQLLPGRFR